MAVKKSPAEAAKNWSDRFGASGASYTAGINAVQTAPGQLAAAQKGLYVANVTAAANTWATKVASISLQDWKNAATTTGAQRLATGAAKGAPKMQAFMVSYLPKLSGIVDSLPPRGQFSQNVQRLNTYLTQLHEAKGTF